MNKILRLGTFMGLLLGFITSQAQTNLYFRGSLGELTTIPVSSVKNITFSNGKVNVNKLDGNTSAFGYSTLRYFSFSDLTTGIEPIVELTNNIAVYPNPVTDILTLRSDQQVKSLSIEFFDLVGNSVLSSSYKSDDLLTNIDLTQFTAGLYLCRIVADGEVKTVKIIKN